MSSQTARTTFKTKVDVYVNYFIFYLTMFLDIDTSAKREGYNIIRTRALSLPELQLSGTNSEFLSVSLALSVLLP